MKNNSVMKCCVCNNKKSGEFITIDNKKYHLCCIEQLKDNWNKLKEIAKSQSGFKKRADLKGGLWFEINDLLETMQEIEQGSDSNE